MREIKLTQGKVALVDDQDYLRLTAMGRWHAQKGVDTYYAQRSRGVMMHRVIMDAPKGMVVDHINGNGLDNRRENLRVVTYEQNARNTNRGWGTSEYLGVSWNKSRRKWQAQTRIRKVPHHLGFFDTEEQAARAVDRKRRQVFGEVAKANLPPESSEGALLGDSLARDAPPKSTVPVQEETHRVSAGLLGEARPLASEMSWPHVAEAQERTESCAEDNCQTAASESRKMVLGSAVARPMTLAITWRKPHDFQSSFAVKRDGTLWAWGNNEWGQLGLGDRNDRATPAQVGHDSDWATLATGGASLLATKRDGTLWAWGEHDVGDWGDRDDRDAPTRIGGDSRWVSVINGFAIDRDGALWAWGANDFGDLGLGDHTYRDTPTRVNSSVGWATVSSCWASFGVKQDGTLWAWGYNDFGLLGLGDYDGRDTPTQVGRDRDWLTVTTGNSWEIAFAIKRDGTLWAWGDNDLGLLGLGDCDRRDTPTQVGYDGDWLSVVTDGSSSFAMKRDGTLWAWGQNGQGKLGVGDCVYRDAPTQVGSASGWMTLATDGESVIAIKREGTLWAWGSNKFGQLGLGDRDDRHRPTQIGQDCDWA